MGPSGRCISGFHRTSPWLPSSAAPSWRWPVADFLGDVVVECTTIVADEAGYAELRKLFDEATNEAPAQVESFGVEARVPFRWFAGSSPSCSPRTAARARSGSGRGWRRNRERCHATSPEGRSRSKTVSLRPSLRPNGPQRARMQPYQEHATGLHLRASTSTNAGAAGRPSAKPDRPGTPVNQ